MEQQQNEKAKGFYVGGESPYPESVKFSNNYGWSNINNQKIDIKQYDGPVKSAFYDENNGYEKYIQNLGLNVNIRLILKEKIESLRLKYFLDKLKFILDRFVRCRLCLQCLVYVFKWKFL